MVYIFIGKLYFSILKKLTKGTKVFQRNYLDHVLKKWVHIFSFIEFSIKADTNYYTGLLDSYFQTVFSELLGKISSMNLQKLQFSYCPDTLLGI